jgi:predicted nucleic acid-binding protein
VYLVDTNVLSAASPTQAAAAPGLVAWMDRNSDSLYLSVITIAKIEAGIAKNRGQGADRKAERLAEWLAVLVHLYGGRILPVDPDVAGHIGRLIDRTREQGRKPDLADLAIAATALCHGWTVLTRNLRHFSPLGVPVRDPFTSLPSGAPGP